jgi:hypothetical protein
VQREPGDGEDPEGSTRLQLCPASTRIALQPFTCLVISPLHVIHVQALHSYFQLACYLPVSCLVISLIRMLHLLGLVLAFASSSSSHSLPSAAPGAWIPEARKIPIPTPLHQYDMSPS